MPTEAAHSVSLSLSPGVAREVVGAAAAAPSIHNTQPWLWRLGAGGLTLLADGSRRLAVTDPEGRQLLLSCGAALCNATLALRARGLVPRVTILPDGDDHRTDPLATITVAGQRPADDAERALADAIPHRRTDRRPFDDRPLPDGAVARLRAAAEARGAWLTALTDPDLRVQVNVLLSRADWIEQHDAAYRRELESWIRGEAAPDGVPRGAVLAAGGTRQSEFPLRELDLAARTDPPPASEPGVERPGVLLIGTDADTAAERLRAGEAMQRVLLTATSLGLAASPMSQAIDVEGLRDRFRAATGGLGQVQMILRVGHAPVGADPLAPTPRRGVDEILQLTD